MFLSRIDELVYEVETPRRIASSLDNLLKNTSDIQQHKYMVVLGRINAILKYTYSEFCHALNVLRFPPCDEFTIS